MEGGGGKRKRGYLKISLFHGLLCQLKNQLKLKPWAPFFRDVFIFVLLSILSKEN